MPHEKGKQPAKKPADSPPKVRVLPSKTVKVEVVHLVPSPTHGAPKSDKLPNQSPMVQSKPGETTGSQSPQRGPKTNDREERSAAFRQRDQDSLRNEIESCLTKQTSQAVDLSKPRHGVTTPVLRQFVYDARFNGGSLPVVFRDGSRPSPFPVGRLSDHAEPPPVPESQVVRLGLMSFRHPELDFIVDIYVARNKELGDHAPYAEGEELAFERTVEVLNDPIAKDGAELWVYHTGFEPMVIGFYRAVVHVIEERAKQGLPRTLCIRPFFYIPQPSEPPFTRESPGARQESYRPEKAWW